MRGCRAPYSKCWVYSVPLRFSAAAVARHSPRDSSAVVSPVLMSRPCYPSVMRGGAEAVVRGYSTAAAAAGDVVVAL